MDDPKSSALINLRDRIYHYVSDDQIARKNTLDYLKFFLLDNLIFENAQRFFPDWHGAFFYLNLITRELSLKLSTYPDQFGGCREYTQALTAELFHTDAVKYGLAGELCWLQTQEDWDALFDAPLKAAIDKARLEIQARQDEIRRQERERQIVIIPVEIAQRRAAMDIVSLSLKIFRRYSTSMVKLTRIDGGYQLAASERSRISDRYNRDQHRELTSVEAAWVEDALDRCLNSDDTSTWQSAPGGDSMAAWITFEDSARNGCYSGKPSRIYTNLMNALEKLARYGSKVE